jgi:peptide/nickel transport system substrate-binding protein
MNLSKPEDAQTRTRDEMQLAFSLLVDGANSTHGRVAEEIARQWAEVGVRVQVEPGLTRERLESGSYTTALVEWEMPPDPDPYPVWHSTQAGEHGQNYTRFQDREADELMEKGRRIASNEERIEAYQRFQEIWALELPALPLYFPVYSYALDRRVTDVQLGLMLRPCDRFRNVAQWNVLNARECQTSARMH